jgi:formiminoglutamase
MPPIQPVEPTSFFTRAKDPTDPRLAELCKPISDETEGGVAILGYPDDEGILLNGGRSGAALGPAEIRRWLYRMTPHARRPLKAFWDLGDWDNSLPLNQRHEAARAKTSEVLRAGRQLLSFGGGNDYAYADGMGFLDQKFATKPLIINIDAHLDVRDLSRGLTSGTPFFRLLESGVPFDFLEVGIQGQCNSQAHWDYVESKGARVISLDEINDSGLSLSECLVQTAGDWLLKPRPTFLAVDMDAFAWPFAQGTSAAWPLGLDPTQFSVCAQLLYKRLDVRALGIYEVSPPLDQGGGTARLAAQFAHGFLHHV